MSSLTLRPTAPYLPEQNTSCLLWVVRTEQPGQETHQMSPKLILLCLVARTCCTNTLRLPQLSEPLMHAKLSQVHAHYLMIVHKKRYEHCNLIQSLFQTSSAMLPHSNLACLTVHFDGISVLSCVTFILVLSALLQVWQSEWCPCLCWVSMSDGSSHNRCWCGCCC